MVAGSPSLGRRSITPRSTDRLLLVSDTPPATSPDPSDPPLAEGPGPIPRLVTAMDQNEGRGLLLLVVRLLFLVLLVSVSMLTIAGRAGATDFQWQTLFGVLLASTAIGTIVIVVDVMTPSKRLSSVVGVYLGICFGLIAAVAIGSLVDVGARALGADDGAVPVYLGVSKAALALILCYLSVSVVLTTKDDFRLVIPYVEFARQARGVRAMVVDTSALIDGRIDSVGQAGFIDAPVIIPGFVLEELQRLADSDDRQRRFRGRRGLDMVARLQQNPFIDVAIDESRPEGVGVDAMLVSLAREQEMRILTNDQNLRRIAEINGLRVLNLNDLASGLRAAAIPGDQIEIEVVKRGENAEQGVGYLPDGTMVVVEDAANRVGETLVATVTNVLQTSAGRLVFGRPGTDPLSDEEAAQARHSSALRDAATRQPKSLGPGPRADGDRSPRGGRPRRR
jgi:uncharacterized protein YacL